MSQSYDSGFEPFRRMGIIERAAAGGGAPAPDRPRRADDDELNRLAAEEAMLAARMLVDAERLEQVRQRLAVLRGE